MTPFPKRFLSGSIPLLGTINFNSNYMYLAYYQSDYSAKNSLEKAIIDYLKSIDRTLIHDENFAEFTSKVILKIREMCTENKRCKPKDPHLWNPQVKNKKDCTLSGIDVVNFYFYHSDKTY